MKISPDILAKRRQAQQKSRSDLATATVGLLIALAFGAMVDAVKDPLRTVNTAGLSREILIKTGLMAFIFLCTGFSFFLGCQMYLGDGKVQTERRLQWRWDFFSTVLTLTLLVLLGAYTNPHYASPFVLVLRCLFGFQLIWAVPHLRWRSLRRGWLITNLIVCAATVPLHWLLSIGPWALLWLAFVCLAKLLYDMYSIEI